MDIRNKANKVLEPTWLPVKTASYLFSRSGDNRGHLVFFWKDDSYNLNVTDSACQKEKKKIQTNLTQIYKNMPLDSYQQLRTVGALFTEKKGNIYQYLQQ